MAVWPDKFQRYVEAEFGVAICLRVTGSVEKLKMAEGYRERTLKEAKSTDAMNESTAMLPAGSWRQARHGRHSLFWIRPSGSQR